MLKKTLFLLSVMVLLAAAPVGATVVDVINDGYDDNDSSGSITSGDVVHIKVVSSVLISSIDFSLAVTGPGLCRKPRPKLVYSTIRVLQSGFSRTL